MFSTYLKQEYGSVRVVKVLLQTGSVALQDVYAAVACAVEDWVKPQYGRGGRSCVSKEQRHLRNFAMRKRPEFAYRRSDAAPHIYGIWALR